VKHNLLYAICSILLLYLFTYTDANERSKSTSPHWEVCVRVCLHLCTYKWCLKWVKYEAEWVEWCMWSWINISISVVIPTNYDIYANIGQGYIFFLFIIRKIGVGVYMVTNKYQHFICYPYQLRYLCKYRMRILFVIRKVGAGVYMVTYKYQHFICYPYQLRYLCKFRMRIFFFLTCNQKKGGPPCNHWQS
jgi:hypothetical protein